MIVQIIFGFSSAFVYAISILYASADLADVTTATSTFPLADIYHQATNSRGGMVGLLLIIYFASIVPVIGESSQSGYALVPFKKCLLVVLGIIAVKRIICVTLVARVAASVSRTGKLSANAHQALEEAPRRWPWSSLTT